MSHPGDLGDCLNGGPEQTLQLYETSAPIGPGEGLGTGLRIYFVFRS